MIGMGIDASTTCIGWCIFNDDELLDYGKLKPTVEGLEWRDRVYNFIPQLQQIIDKYKPQIVYVEDVPLMSKRGNKTLVQLGATQGSIIGLCGANNIKVEFISVSTWRMVVGLFDGTEKGKERDEMKVKSIQKVNELFNINLSLVFTKNGNYNPNKSDDDISDSILIYCSTRDKYKVKKGFGRR